MKQDPSSSSDRLAEVLRHADQDVAYSDGLHRRIMSAVSAQPARQYRFFGIAATVGIAAAIALVMFLWHPAPPSQPTVAVAPRSISILASAPSMQVPIHRALDARYAYLDRDARDFGRFIMDQVAVPARLTANAGRANPDPR